MANITSDLKNYLTSAANSDIRVSGLRRVINGVIGSRCAKSKSEQVCCKTQKLQTGYINDLMACKGQFFNLEVIRLSIQSVRSILVL